MNKQYNVKKVNGSYRSNAIIIDLYNQGILKKKEGYDDLDFIHLAKLMNVSDDKILKLYPSYKQIKNNYDEIIDLFLVPDQDGYSNKLFFFGNKFLRDSTAHLTWVQYLYSDQFSDDDKRQLLQLQGVSLDYYQTFVDDEHHINEVYSHYYNQDHKKIYIDGVLKDQLTFV